MVSFANSKVKNHPAEVLEDKVAAGAFGQRLMKEAERRGVRVGQGPRRPMDRRKVCFWVMKLGHGVCDASAVQAKPPIDWE